jgi:hypothetical protein
VPLLGAGGGGIEKFSPLLLDVVDVSKVVAVIVVDAFAFALKKMTDAGHFRKMRRLPFRLPASLGVPS